MILLFPYLHAASLPEPLPGSVRLFCPGLEDHPPNQSSGRPLDPAPNQIPVQSLDQTPDQAPGRAWRPDALPFTPAEARRVLGDLKAYAGELAGRSRTGGNALDPAGAISARRTIQRDIARGDAEALRRLGVSAGPAGDYADSNGQNPLEARVCAHKVLLLTWDLEEQCLEARGLIRKFGANRAGLPDVVGAERDERNTPGDLSELEPFTPGLPGDPGAPVINAWERILRAMSVFAPADTIFWAGHPAIVKTLEERGLRFEEGGPDGSADGVPVDAPADARFAAAPLGRILGRIVCPSRPEDFKDCAGRETAVITIAAAAKQV